MAVGERMSLTGPARATVSPRRWWQASGTTLALLTVVLAMPFARGQPVSAQGLTVTGYADFEAIMENIGSTDKGFFFDNHHVNLIMVGRITGNLFAAAELEYEHAGDETALEYGYLAYTGIKDVRIIAGKFIVPFGRFNKDLHPTTINKVPFRPHGFSQILPQTYNDVGVWLSVAKAIDDDNRFVLDAFIVNGLLGEDGGSIRSMRDNCCEDADFGRDNNKAIGGRVGIEMPFVGLDLGGSVYRGKYAESEEGLGLNLTLLGLDAAYRNSGFTVRGELVRASQDASVEDLTKTGGFVQASYMINGRVEPVVQYSTRNMPGESGDLSRVAVGAGFVISPASMVRLVYASNMEKSGFESDNNAFIAQFNVMF